MADQENEMRIDDDIESISRDKRALPDPPDNKDVQATLIKLSESGVGIKLKILGVNLQQIAFLISQVIYDEMLWNEANAKKSRAKAAARDHIKKIKKRQKITSRYNREKHLRSLTIPIARKLFASIDAVKLKHSKTKHKPYFDIFLLLLLAVLRKHTNHPYKFIAALIHRYDLYDKGYCKLQCKGQDKQEREPCRYFTENKCSKNNPFTKPCFATTRHRVYQRIRAVKNKYPNFIERLDDPLNKI